MNTSTPEQRRKRSAELAELLSEGEQPELERSPVDEKLDDPAMLEWVGGRDQSGVPEFVEHECWRMLLVFPDEAEPTLPGRIECGGCGAIFRAELEYRP